MPRKTGYQLLGSEVHSSSFSIFPGRIAFCGWFSIFLCTKKVRHFLIKWGEATGDQEKNPAKNADSLTASGFLPFFPCGLLKSEGLLPRGSFHDPKHWLRQQTGIETFSFKKWGFLILMAIIYYRSTLGEKQNTDTSTLNYPADSQDDKLSPKNVYAYVSGVESLAQTVPSIRGPTVSCGYQPGKRGKLKKWNVFLNLFLFAATNNFV